MQKGSLGIVLVLVAIGGCAVGTTDATQASDDTACDPTLTACPPATVAAAGSATPHVPSSAPSNTPNNNSNNNAGTGDGGASNNNGNSDAAAQSGSDGGAISNPVTDSGATLANGECSAKTTADSCYTCCDDAHTAGGQQWTQAFGDCACGTPQNPGICGNVCGNTYCTDGTDIAGSACDTCLNNSANGACGAQADATCAGTTACKAWETCLDASACDSKP